MTQCISGAEDRHKNDVNICLRVASAACSTYCYCSTRAIFTVRLWQSSRKILKRKTIFNWWLTQNIFLQLCKSKNLHDLPPICPVAASVRRPESPECLGHLRSLFSTTPCKASNNYLNRIFVRQQRFTLHFTFYVAAVTGANRCALVRKWHTSISMMQHDKLSNETKLWMSSSP